MIPLSSFNLKSLFLGLPTCPFGVTVPISIKPKPKFANSLYKTAFLSKPAAKPTGFLKVNPNRLRSNFLSLI